MEISFSRASASSQKSRSFRCKFSTRASREARWLSIWREAGEPPEGRQPGGPGAWLSGHQLPAALGGAPDGEGLEQTEGLDGVGQLVQLLLSEDAAGLVRVGRNGVYWEK